MTSFLDCPWMRLNGTVVDVGFSCGGRNWVMVCTETVPPAVAYVDVTNFYGFPPINAFLSNLLQLQTYPSPFLTLFYDFQSSCSEALFVPFQSHQHPTPLPTSANRSRSPPSPMQSFAQFKHVCPKPSKAQRQAEFRTLLQTLPITPAKGR